MENFTSLDELSRKLKISRVTIWRMVRDGLFPAPIRISARRVGWPDSVLVKWQAKKIGEAEIDL